MRALRSVAIAFVLCLSAAATRVHAQAQEGAPAASAAPVHEVKLDDNAFRWTDRPEWTDPPPPPAAHEAAQAAPLYYRLRDTQFHVERVPEAYVHQILVANEASALSQLGQVEIAFVPAWQTLRLHVLRILRDGASIDKRGSVQIRFLERELGLEQGLYTGAVTASLLIDDVRVGDALDIEYTTAGNNPVFPARFADTASWDYSAPTELRRVVLKAPAERKIAVHVYGPEPQRFPVGKKRREGAFETTTFEERDVPTAHVLAHYPADFDPVRYIEFSEYRDWNEIAVWAAGLFRDARPDDTVAALARQFGEGSEQQRVADALRYVQREIRYFSVSLGESSHRPAAPAVTLSRRFGDCKDKTALLIALLKAMHIDAEPVLVPFATDRTLGKRLPSPEQFNHVIVHVALGRKDYYLDPTVPEQLGELDALHEWEAGSDLLPASPDTRKLVHLNAPMPEQAQIDVVERMKIAQFDAPLALDVDVTLRGAFAEVTRIALRKSTAEERVRDLKSVVVQRYPGAELVGNEKVTDDPAHNRITLSSTYRLPANALKEHDGVYVARYMPEPVLGHLPLPEADRDAPLRIASIPQHYRYEFHLIAPASVVEARDPRTLLIGKSYFKFEQQSRFRGNEAAEIFDLRVPDETVAVGNLNDYAAEVRRIGELHAALVFAGKPGKAGAATPDPVAAREAELKNRIKQISATLDSGKLGDRDHAAALLERAAAYDELAQSEQALTDYDLAVKLAPKNPSAYAERGSALLGAGRAKQAIEDYSRALALGIEDIDGVLTRRGIAEFFAGDVDAALDDLRRAAGDDAHYAYGTLWYSLVAARAGKTPDASFVEARKRATTDEWPRPLYRLFDGEAAVADIERMLAATNAAERKLDSCEGYFYIGEYFLSRNDPARAKEYFTKSIDTGVRFYNEYRMSTLELDKLQ